MSDVERWTIWVCPRHPQSLRVEETPSVSRFCGIPDCNWKMEPTEVVDASELERVEAERDALTKAAEPLVDFCQVVAALDERLVPSRIMPWITELVGEAQDALRQSERIIREGLAAQEETE